MGHGPEDSAFLRPGITSPSLQCLPEAGGAQPLVPAGVGWVGVLCKSSGQHSLVWVRTLNSNDDHRVMRRGHIVSMRFKASDY